MSDLSRVFLNESGGFLRSEFLPRIRDCVGLLPRLGRDLEFDRPGAAHPGSARARPGFTEL
jgi:hypothetical protein